MGRKPKYRAGGPNGLLVINKPENMISKDVSRWLEKRMGRMRLGHVGTLDPSASGVLPLLLGRATRLQDYLLDLPKSYEFDITFGTETDTLDREGEVVATAPFDHVTKELLLGIMPQFVGDIVQIPPLYSAVKYQGKPLYEYARAGKVDDVPLAELKRTVSISNFEMLAYEDGVGTFCITCSRGTYVRTLVKDVANALGTCGNLTRLVRTQAAGVHIDKAWNLDEVEARLPELSELLTPVEQIDLGVSRWRSEKKLWVDRLCAGEQIVIETPLYLSGVEERGLEGQTAAALTGWAKPLVLLNENGRAFGMGAARRQQETGRVVINMKRGF